MVATSSAPSSRGFRTFGLVTIAAVYFLIAVGGIVRASGSGMGCPDWPKCFGRWVPPTQESQLPENYREIYSHRGYGEEGFNAFKTWTEYVNRLIGVVIGLLIFGFLLASLRFWRTDRAVVWWSLAAFLLVGFQGWLGSVVVATNLAPWMVTVHMLLALVIVGILIYALVRGAQQGAQERVPSQSAAGHHGRDAARSQVRWLFVLCLLLSLIQIGTGTQVREQIDEVARVVSERAAWIGDLGSLVLVHRSFSLLLVLANGALVYLLWRRSPAAADVGKRLGLVRRLGVAMFAILVAEATVGTLLFYLGVPALLQPVHLLLAALLAGVQLAMWILFSFRSYRRR